LELGKVYVSERRSEDAERELRLALAENPGDADANYFLGGLLVQLESRYKDAIPYLEQARKLKPDGWATYLYLGKAKLKLEETVEAVGLLKRAVELNPDEPPAHYLLWQALRACGRDAEASRVLRELKALALKTVTPDDMGVAGAR